MSKDKNNKFFTFTYIMFMDRWLENIGSGEHRRNDFVPRTIGLPRYTPFECHADDGHGAAFTVSPERFGTTKPRKILVGFTFIILTTRNIIYHGILVLIAFRREPQHLTTRHSLGTLLPVSRRVLNELFERLKFKF